MKKILSVLLSAICILSINLCSANLHDYYENNPDYVYVATGHFSAYLYLPSVDVQEYNPPHYQIAGLFVGTDGLDRKVERIEIVRFNWDTKETFHLNKNGYWEKEEVYNDNRQIYYEKKRANALFRAAYGMDFYGD